MFTIYKATNTKTGKCYIGFDSHWPNRMKIHKSSYKKQDSKFYRAVRKYGWESFVWDILYQSDDKEHTLTAMEPFYIAEHNSFHNGYNSTLGGDGTFGMKISSEAKAKISQKNKFPKPQTDEHVKNRIASLKRNPNAFKGMKGKTHSAETRDILRKNMVGRKKSSSHIENMRLRPQNTTILTCEYCGKIGNYMNMKQWHGDKCKQNPNGVNESSKNVTCSVCSYTTKRSPNFYRYHEKNCLG